MTNEAPIRQWRRPFITSMEETDSESDSEDDIARDWQLCRLQSADNVDCGLSVLVVNVLLTPLWPTVVQYSTMYISVDNNFY